MPKHTAPATPTPIDTRTPEVAAEIARILDLETTRAFDGHFVATAAGGKVSGAILHAHDQATVLTFDLAVTVS